MIGKNINIRLAFWGETSSLKGGPGLFTILCGIVVGLMLTSRLAHAKPLDELLQLLPGGGTVAMGVDFRELRKSTHFAAAVGLLADMDDVGAFRIGSSGPLSPDNVDEMAVVVLTNGQPVVAIRGEKLDPDVVTGHYRGVLGSKFKDSKSGGRHVFTVEPNIDAFFADAKTVVVGRPKELAEAVAVSNKQKKSLLGAGSLKGRIKKAKRSEPFWITGELSAKNRKQLKKRSAGALADIVGFTGHASLSTGFDFLLKTDCASEEGSNTLSRFVGTRLDGLREKTAFRLLGIGAYLDKIQVESKGKTVELVVKLAETQVNTLMIVGPQVYRAIRN